MKTRMIFALVLGAGLIGNTASAEMPMESNMSQPGGGMGGMRHHMHGPVGVKGRHILPEGKFVLTYRAGHMAMGGNRAGTTDLDPTFIATTVPNRFSGRPGQPPTLRVVPTEMTGTMHMVGAMYGVTDRLTVGAMAPWIRKSMTSLTFAGPVGPTVLGANGMDSEGWGDVRLSARYRAIRQGRRSLLLGLGLSLPTGSITETGPMLSPSGRIMVGRMAYGMQLGSGTFDLHPALTWQNGRGRLNWGGQLAATLRLGSNEEGYTLGNAATATTWISHRTADWVSLSGRIEARSAGHIDGIDPAIVMPTQGADPLNYGGQSVALYAAADFSPQDGPLRGHKIGLELGVPVYQHVNGVQLKRDWSLTLAWRKPF